MATQESSGFPRVEHPLSAGTLLGAAPFGGWFCKACEV